MQNILSTKKEKAFSLVELLLTILIMSIILLVVSVMLIAIVRSAQRTDVRRTVRQDMDEAYEIIQRDLRNSDAAFSLSECDTDTYVYELAGTNPDVFSLFLVSNVESVDYSVNYYEDYDINGLARNYNGDSTSTVVVSGGEVDVTSFTITCTPLISGRKFLLMEMHANSVTELNSGPIANDIVKYGGVVIRNSSE